MPTYYPLQAKVQLCTSSLAHTTTSIPERQKGKFATAKTENAEDAIKNGRVMKETLIALGEDDARLHFIGPNEEMPFYLMHACEDIPNPPGEETAVERALQKLKLYASRPKFEHDGEKIAPESTPIISKAPSITPQQFALEIEKRRSSPIKGHGLPGYNTNLPGPADAIAATNQHSLRHGSGMQDQDPSLTPQALGLSFSLSDQTFVPNFAKDKPNALQDIKIDVYVNGEFTECTTAPARGAGEYKSKIAQESMAPLFSGKRVHRMVERALILVPPHQHANGSMRDRNRSRASLAGPEERWNQVNAAILDEANKLGFNGRGDRPPVGVYLASVAALSMPPVVEKFQKAGGPKFGVIDIVISAGTGWKYPPTSSYIMGPTRTTDRDFKAKATNTSGEGDSLPVTEAAVLVEAEVLLDEKGLPGEKALPEETADIQSSAHQATDVPEKNEEKSDVKESEQPEVPLQPDRPITLSNDETSFLNASTISLPSSQGFDHLLEPPVIFRPSQTPSMKSSPEADSLRTNVPRPRTTVSRAEMNSLLGTSMRSSPAMSSPQSSMLPPQTPLSSFSNAHKRRRSDLIMSPDTLPPTKRNRGSSISNVDRASGPIGITRRGQFTRDGKDLTGSPKGPTVTDTNIQTFPAKVSLVRRIVIKNQGRIIVDRHLINPLPLCHKEIAPEVAAIPSSPVYPLPESVVFGTRNFGDIATPIFVPTPMFQAPTPQPSSSPTRKPRQSKSSSPRKGSQTPFSERSHVAKPGRVRARDQIDHVGELHAAWKTPELSKDCVVSFAEDGPWRTSANGKGGVWRQIRSGRPGFFKENEVLFGVRYLIG